MARCPVNQGPWRCGERGAQAICDVAPRGAGVPAASAWSDVRYSLVCLVPRNDDMIEVVVKSGALCDLRAGELGAWGPGPRGRGALDHWIIQPHCS